MRIVILALATTCAAGAAVAQPDTELARLKELDRKCEQARTEKLAPIRRELIERCVRENKRAQADCEAEFGDWGDTRPLASGGARGGKFYDLPECVAAARARAGYRQ